MSERSTNLLLQDILEAIKNIEAFTKGLTIDQYEADLKTKFAVERNFIIKVPAPNEHNSVNSPGRKIKNRIPVSRLFIPGTEHSEYKKGHQKIEQCHQDGRTGNDKPGKMNLRINHSLSLVF